MYYNLKYYSDNGKMINFAFPEGIVITDIKGLSATSVSRITSQGVYQVGTTVEDESVDGKTIVVSGQIVGDSTQKKRQIIDTIVPKTGATFVYNNEKEMRVNVSVSPETSRAKFDADFQFTLYAPYPYWRSIDKARVRIGGLLPRFKFPINYYDPITHKFGENVPTYFVDAENKGNVPAPFDLVFLAKQTVTNHRVTKVDTGEYIQLGEDIDGKRYIMTAGEKAEVKMIGDKLQVDSTRGGVTTDIIDKLAYYSTPFELDVGENLLRYDATVNRENLQVDLLLHPAWSGAYGDDNTFV